MLELMRKHAKGWMMKVILGLIIVVFVFYFGSMHGDKGAEALVKIEGKKITYSDYYRQYEDIYNSYKRYFGGNVPEPLLKELKQQAFESLINRTIVINRADDLGITASEDEVRGSILFQPQFQKNGVFDQRIYQYYLRSVKMTAEDFEKNQRASIISTKMEALIKEGAQVSDQELFDVYALQTGKINIDFIRISADDFRNRVKPSDADLEKFLKDSGNAFRVPERVQARYLFFDGNDYAGSVRVSEQDIDEYYAQHRKEFEKAGQKELTPALKQKITSDIKLSKALDEAYLAVKKARDTIYQYDNFEEYAKKNNLTPRSTDFFPKDKPTAELDQIKDLPKHLADLKKGDLSPILSTPRGYYLLKIADIKSSYVPPLAEVRDRVTRAYAEKEATILAGKEADRMLASLRKGEDFKTLAQSKGLKTTETGLFTPGVEIPKIGKSRELGLALYQLTAKNPYPENVFNIKDDFFIVRFRDRGSIDKQDFEKNKPALTTGYRRMKEGLYFDSWMADQRDKLTKAGDLKIYKQPSEL